MRLRRIQTIDRDTMNGWWENQFGDWFRDTPNGDALDGLLDRLAEDYAASATRSVAWLEEQIDKTFKRFPTLAHAAAASESPFPKPLMEVIQKL